MLTERERQALAAVRDQWKQPPAPCTDEDRDIYQRLAREMMEDTERSARSRLIETEIRQLMHERGILLRGEAN